MQNKLENASVSQHCYPKSDLVKDGSEHSLSSIVYESINGTHF
jgi:hypothetical protein